MKKILLLFLALLFCNNIYASDTKSVYINKIVDHPALDETTRGIIDGLKESGYTRGNNLEVRVESAQGNASLSSQIASNFISFEPDIVVGIGTISAQSFIKYTKSKHRLVFSSVTDPKGAGLASKNISGISNFVPLEPQIELFKKLQPNLKKLGIIYNAGEANSEYIITKLENIAIKYDIEIVKKNAIKTSEVGAVARHIASEVDAIFISNDNTALAAIQSIIITANKYNIPVYTSDTDAVEGGCLAALGPNQYRVGIQTGKMVGRILDGKDINSQPIEYPDSTELYINLKAAQKIGIKLPDELIGQAKVVIGY
jgi:putative ABC transport system substrate-binding protein